MSYSLEIQARINYIYNLRRVDCDFFSPHVEYEVYEVGEQTAHAPLDLVVLEARPRNPVVREHF